MTTRLLPPQNQTEQALMEEFATLRFLGNSQEEAARLCGIAVSTGRKWERSPWWRPLVVDKVERKHVTKLTSKAMRVMENTLDLGLKEDASVREQKLAFEAAKWQLDRAAQSIDHSQEQRSHLEKKLEDLPPEDLRLLIERLRTAPDGIIDVEESGNESSGGTGPKELPGLRTDDESGLQD